ncbi:hypothetical protein KC340_g1068 [Hortaea werneckii]|nr:hypothetical protein KC342_g4924 [Hortaea werneckii]KAI7107511.1 hypothetical protein KC339_g2310 [Hortaea werneckii]KAI7244542.1 hypothetical protein KC365_g1329 [Hortaea werneckii]KAI7338129.1 hypothetical protein KC340_g1068 [Hortaea werneckii]KAI7377499.1 hypothetical protein KC328_g14390 [Hortaea werneckii]
MARPSKSHQFAIYHDTGLPTPDSSYIQNLDDPIDEKREQEEEEDQGRNIGNDCENATLEIDNDLDITETVPARQPRSARSSISSMSDEKYETTIRRATQPIHTPRVIRPSFMRPESVKRMQLNSPPPFGAGSPRQSLPKARGINSRPATPRSHHSAKVRGSPNPRHQARYSTHELESKQNPLVLLHITVLPVNIPWRHEIVQEIMPAPILDQIYLLRSKLTEIVMQRGILIPHPREEYELLEERVLEALELRQERITKDGHFHRPRGSASSIWTSDSTDSGLGSSVEAASDPECCPTCSYGASKSASTGVWKINIYAANGLMRAAAWSAAWSEMERVDVEILPAVPDDIRRLLDSRRDEEASTPGNGNEIPAASPRVSLSTQMPTDHIEPQPSVLAGEASQGGNQTSEMDILRQQAVLRVPAEQIFPVRPKKQGSSSDELPQIYRPSQIPLSMLIRNYLILLLRDGKHVIAFVLAAILMLSGVRLIIYPPQSTSEGGITYNATSPTEELSNGSYLDTLSDVVLPSVVPSSAGPFASEKEIVPSVSSNEGCKMRQPIDQRPSSEEETFSSFGGDSTAEGAATSTSSEVSEAETSSVVEDTPVGLWSSEEHNDTDSTVTEGLSASSQDGSEEGGQNPEQAIDAQPDFEHEANYLVEHKESKFVEPSERVEFTEHKGNSMHGQDSESDDLGKSAVAPAADSTGVALEPEREPKANHQVTEEICLVPTKVDLEELQCTEILDSSVDSDEVGKEIAFTGGVAIDIPEEICLIPSTPFMEQAQCTGVPSEMTDKQEVGQEMVSDGKAETGISKDTFLLPDTSAEKPQYSQERSSLEDAREGAQEVVSDGEADGGAREVSLFSTKYPRFEQCSISGEGEHTDTSALL